MKSNKPIQDTKKIKIRNFKDKNTNVEKYLYKKKC